jgi:serine/threonine-protein phosphatase 2A regulatory subunit B
MSEGGEFPGASAAADAEYGVDPAGDTITALEYSANGEYLATGDRNGHITVLRMDMDAKAQRGQELWLPYFQFQSHEPEFDFLKSLEIESKINQIKFSHGSDANNFILSANDKTIKLWRIGQHYQYTCSAVDHYSMHRRLQLPQRQQLPSNPESAELANQANVTQLQAINKRVFANAHAYHINSLALSTDNETFFSADDLRVNWWKLDASDTTFTLIDIKPENMEELTEVITAVQCHPLASHQLIYSSSRGAIKVCDTRLAALCTTYPRIYSDQSASTASKSFITDILNSISDVCYSADGRYIIARDYLTIKIWDVNVERRPVKTIALHDYLRPMLYDLYTSDTIFDKFEVGCSADGKSMATGSYSNQLKVFHQDGRGLRNVNLPQTLDATAGGNAAGMGNNSMTGNSNNIMHQAMIVQDAEEASGSSSSGSANSVSGLSRQFDRSNRITSNSSRRGANSSNNNNNSNSEPLEVRLEEKVLHCAWHPTANTIAVAGKVGLCLYKV